MGSPPLRSLILQGYPLGQASSRYSYKYYKVNPALYWSLHLLLRSSFDQVSLLHKELQYYFAKACLGSSGYRRHSRYLCGPDPSPLLFQPRKQESILRLHWCSCSQVFHSMGLSFDPLPQASDRSSLSLWYLSHSYKLLGRDNLLNGSEHQNPYLADSPRA